jgi:hypothetical protein
MTYAAENSPSTHFEVERMGLAYQEREFAGENKVSVLVDE